MDKQTEKRDTVSPLGQLINHFDNLDPNEKYTAQEVVNYATELLTTERGYWLKSATPNPFVTEEEIKKWPLEGICGKCGSYRVKLNKYCLCELCVQSGVKTVSTDAIPESIKRLTRLRDISLLPLAAEPVYGVSVDQVKDILLDYEILTFPPDDWEGEGDGREPMIIIENREYETVFNAIVALSVQKILKS